MEFKYIIYDRFTQMNVHSILGKKSVPVVAGKSMITFHIDVIEIGFDRP